MIYTSIRKLWESLLAVASHHVTKAPSVFPSFVGWGHSPSSSYWPISDSISIPPLVKGSESRSVVSNSLQLHGLQSPWNSPGKNIGVGSWSLLQEVFPMQGSNPGLMHCRWICYQLSHEGSPIILGCEPGSPALQTDSLPTEPSW